MPMPAFQQSGLPEKDSLDLEQIVFMLFDAFHRRLPGQELKWLAVDAETEGCGQRLVKRLVPVMVKIFQSLKFRKNPMLIRIALSVRVE